jgi:hypothetical protein
MSQVQVGRTKMVVSQVGEARRRRHSKMNAGIETANRLLQL